jgi:hypothetical protein
MSSVASLGQKVERKGGTSLSAAQLEVVDQDVEVWVSAQQPSQIRPNDDEDEEYKMRDSLLSDCRFQVQATSCRPRCRSGKNKVSQSLRTKPEREKKELTMI